MKSYSQEQQQQQHQQTTAATTCGDKGVKELLPAEKKSGVEEEDSYKKSNKVLVKVKHL